MYISANKLASRLAKKNQTKTFFDKSFIVAQLLHCLEFCLLCLVINGLPFSSYKRLSHLDEFDVRDIKVVWCKKRDA